MTIQARMLASHPGTPYSSSPNQYTTPLGPFPTAHPGHAFPFEGQSHGQHAAHVLEENGSGGGHWSQRKSESTAPLTTASVTANCQWLGR